MVCSNRFWYAPSVARVVDTLLMALSRVVMAFWAPVVVVTSTPPTEARLPELVLILLMALTLTVLQAHLTRGPARASLQAVADRLAVQQHEPRVLVRVSDACVVAGPSLLNHWLATGVLVFRPP